VGRRARAAHKLAGIASKYSGRGNSPAAAHADRIVVGHGGKLQHGHDQAADYRRARKRGIHHEMGMDPDRGRLPKGAGFYRHIKDGHKPNKAGYHKYVNKLLNEPHKIARWRNQVESAHKLNRAGVKGHRDNEHKYDKYHPLHVPRHRLPAGTNAARGRRSDPVRSAVNHAKGVKGRQARGHARHAASMAQHAENSKSAPDHMSRDAFVRHHRTQMSRTGSHKAAGDPIVRGTDVGQKIVAGKKEWSGTTKTAISSGEVPLPRTAGRTAQYMGKKKTMGGGIGVNM